MMAAVWAVRAAALPTAVVVVAVALAAATLLRASAVRGLGGLTGDVMGALVVVAEMSALALVYGGPRAGERRRIDSHSHRDHSWTSRCTHDTPWVPRFKRSLDHALGHFWPSIQTDTMHVNSIGRLHPDHPIPEGAPRSGSWIADAEGTRAIRSSTGSARFEDDLRTAMSFDFGFELADGAHLTVRTTRKLAQTRNGLMRAENDAEARLDCFEPFFEFEVLETGERGYGVVEYSMEPSSPRYRF